MKVTVGLDLASTAGVSVVRGNDSATAELLEHFVVKRQDELVGGKYAYPWSYLWAARAHATAIVDSLRPIREKHDFLFDDDFSVVIEETNVTKGSRYAQKYLEFLHAAVVEKLAGRNLRYLSTTTWRSALGVTVGKDGRKQNRKLSEIRDDALVQVLTATVGPDASKATKKQVAAAKKSPEFRVLVAKAKLAAGIGGKVSTKHAAVNYVNNRFGLALKKKDDDAADAVCVALASLVPGVKFCDGR